MQTGPLTMAVPKIAQVNGNFGKPQAVDYRRKSVEVQRQKRWYHVGLVIRDARDKVESKKFEMWLDGKRIAQEKGANSTLTVMILASVISTRTPSTMMAVAGSDLDWFGGRYVYGSAFDEGGFADLAKSLSVEPQGKFTTTWANLKAQRTEK